MFLSSINQVPIDSKVLLDGPESKPVVFVANHAFLWKYFYEALLGGLEGENIRKELIGASRLIANIVADIAPYNDETEVSSPYLMASVVGKIMAKS